MYKQIVKEEKERKKNFHARTILYANESIFLEFDLFQFVPHVYFIGVLGEIFDLWTSKNEKSRLRETLGRFKRVKKW
jgi:hypothetical protein